MPVRVPVVSGKDPFEQLLEIGLGARPRLHQRQPRGGVRQEHMGQPALGSLRDESSDPGGDVDHSLPAGFNLEFRNPHALTP